MQVVKLLGRRLLQSGPGPGLPGAGEFAAGVAPGVAGGPPGEARDRHAAGEEWTEIERGGGVGMGRIEILESVHNVVSEIELVLLDAITMHLANS